MTERTRRNFTGQDKARIDRFLKSATQKVPLLLQQQDHKQPVRNMDSDLLNQWMGELRREFAPLPKPARIMQQQAQATIPRPPEKGDHLNQQLSLLKAMFDHQDRKDYRLNFDYITQRSLHLMRHGRFDDFGDVKLFAHLRERAEAVAARWH